MRANKKKESDKDGPGPVCSRSSLASSLDKALAGLEGKTPSLVRAGCCPFVGRADVGLRHVTRQKHPRNVKSNGLKNLPEMTVYTELLNCDLPDMDRLTCEYLGKTCAGVSCDTGDPVYHQPWKERNP
jgi:hypothetical protein